MPTPVERLQRSGITPDRALGQNFLIDPNILDVIERSASLGRNDVVLEVGPGLGVLTERLLDRCRLVHCVELDRRLAALLQEEFGSRPGFRIHRADAMRLDFAALDPPPGKFVANLPYNVAAPLVMKSIQELPTVKLWCLMVQKEIADRLFAAPGTAAYGAISVMIQLMTLKVSSRNISGSVFFPRPRVRSSLLVFRRRPGTRFTARNFTAVKEIVYAAFGQRRKKLANSLAGADIVPEPLRPVEAHRRRQAVEELLGRLDVPLSARPQDLTPQQFEDLARLLIEQAKAADRPADSGRSGGGKGAGGNA
ncbi:MAG: ribosomal RNA small subunit methyltransferase A [Thermoleophilia bacterium]|nr:ribosomal RNA small subunit methyltransferase A [Thermoleophilia bacterium]